MRRKANLLLRISCPNAFISCTPDHRFIINGREIECEKLKMGERIETTNFPLLSNKLSVNCDWAWMLGFFLAEGTIKSGKKIDKRIEFTNQNIEYLRKCERVFHSIGVECKWYIKRGRKDKCIFLRVATPRLLFDYFKEFYYNNEKIIPYFVYDFDKISRLYFLKGFIDGDGDKNLRNYFSQRSPSIINGILYLTQDLDFKSYRISLGENNYGEWFKINLKVYETQNHNIIEKIEEKKIDNYVYDIECEGHIFSAGIGNIVVHNCEHEDYFHRLKQKSYKVFYTNYLKAEYIDKKPPRYNSYRERIYKVFMPKVKEKYKIVGSYFHYSDRLVEAFREWKRKNKK